MWITWINEINHAFIDILKNPVIYWVIILVILTVYKRRKIEKKQFGKHIHSFFPAWTTTLFITIISSISVSFVAIYFGLHITYEIILILSIVTICFSLIYQHIFLSVSYTLGFTYFLLFLSIQNLFENSTTILTSVVFLIGVFLIIEAVLIKTMKNDHFFPERWKTPRGAKYGQYRLQKITIIPCLLFVPDGILAPFYPVFTLGDSQYNIALVPIVLGFSYLAKNNLPQVVAKTVAKRTCLLGIIVIVGSVIGLYQPIILSYVVLLAILGKIVIRILYINSEFQGSPIFFDMENKPTIFWVEKNSLAEKLGLQIGDTIIKINEQAVETREDVDQLLLQHQNEYLTISIEDRHHQQRTINKAVFAKNKEELGVIFIC